MSKQGGRDCGAPKKYDRFYVASLARDCTDEAVGLLTEIMRDKTAKHVDRIKASELLIERGWGKAPQEIRMGNIEGEEGVKFVIEIVDAGKQADGSTGTVAGAPDSHLITQRDDDAAQVAGIPSADSPAAAGGA